ncbi:hypothetical protein GCM10027451_46820 [Geodermatophilus aquaeductus]
MTLGPPQEWERSLGTGTAGEKLPVGNTWTKRDPTPRGQARDPPLTPEGSRSGNATDPGLQRV